MVKTPPPPTKSILTHSSIFKSTSVCLEPNKIFPNKTESCGLVVSSIAMGMRSTYMIIIVETLGTFARNLICTCTQNYYLLTRLKLFILCMLYFFSLSYVSWLLSVYLAYVVCMYIHTSYAHASIHTIYIYIYIYIVFHFSMSIRFTLLRHYLSSES